MKNKEIMIISIATIFISVYVVGYMTTGDSKISEVVTTITAIIGAFAIWFQLKKERELNQAQFIMEYNNTFITNEELVSVEANLEKYRKSGEFIVDENNRQALINYLVYIEALAALVFRKVITIDVIDDLFSYRFFLAMNNPVVQKEELIPEAEYYKGCFRLYKLWISYKEKKNYPVVLVENRLDKVFADFEKYAM